MTGRLAPRGKRATYFLQTVWQSQAGMDTPVSTKTAGSTVDIVTILLLVLTFLAICSRFVTKWAVSHGLNIDDLFLGIAFVGFGRIVVYVCHVN